MTSPRETVDGVFRWLEGVLGVTLPTLPFSGLWRRLTGLFRLPVDVPLPAPGTPLPWTIPVSGSWTPPVPGLSVSLVDLRIRVSPSAAVLDPGPTGRGAADTRP